MEITMNDLKQLDNGKYYYQGKKGNYFIQTAKVIYMKWVNNEEVVFENLYTDLADLLDDINIIESEKNTNLKIYRLLARMTQKDLADISNVNLRMIQGYEQKTKDINKASGLTLYNLAFELGCKIEQLLEI